MKVSELVPSDLHVGNQLRLSWAGEEREIFICTAIGRILYAVSTAYGFAYTRPQLIEKYSKVDADCRVVVSK